MVYTLAMSEGLNPPIDGVSRNYLGIFVRTRTHLKNSSFEFGVCGVHCTFHHQWKTDPKIGRGVFPPLTNLKAGSGREVADAA